jgi:DNA polymerase-3 subunit alpha
MSEVLSHKKEEENNEQPEIAHGLKASDFAHLHNHTHYSLLDGLTKIDDLVDYVKELGMEAVAVTDHGTMSGLIELYKKAKDTGVKPVLGIESYVAARKMTDRDPAHDKQRFHITLLAMNNIGFENLCRLSTEANLNGLYYKPRIDHELMEKYNEGIICLSGCAGSEISERLKANDYPAAKKLVDWYAKTYKDRFYLEMQDHGHPDSPTHWKDQEVVNNGLQKLAKDTGLPLVVTCDGHYLKHEDQDSHEVLLCVGTGSNLSDTKRMSLKDFELHVIPPTDIIKRWGKDFPEAIRNTKRVADRCNVELDLGRILIPTFPVPEGETEKSYLDKLVFRGLAERFGVMTKDQVAVAEVPQIRKLLNKEILERIDYELSVVDKMGYNGYFLIVQDFINWGREQGIVFGPGRGSAAGSLLSYAIRITDLDPLAYGLLFERFLNPDRISMPDIDTDIQDTRRDEVIRYCSEKYGAQRVSNICTFGKMMAKNAVRDVARVLEVPYADADRLAKLVPDPVQGRHVKLRNAIVDDPDLKKEYETNPTAKEVIDYASRLEGTIRSHGVHACGVVIAPDDLVKFLPLEMAGKGVVATQFPMGEIEDLGLLKMDFLGLSNLSVIQMALRIIRKVHGVNINLSDLPLDDKAAYELMQRGETTGVFQLESAGMKRYLKDLKPDTFEDVIAMVALYRPGPMQFIDSFIKRKHGQEPITYLHPGLESALKNTYGILVYQEQFMQISREWCGFTGGESDTLRKAVGKKKMDLMLKMRPKFIEGAVKVGGATEKVAETFWEQLVEFANYCFNKSHAACYAMIAYWTAYLKAHYPAAFMAALMTSDMRWTDRLAIEIAECKRMGIKVLGPDINESYADFATVGTDNTVRFGLAAIKNMGRALVEDEVIAARDSGGKFESVCDFARRINSSKFNKKSWESAIKTGAFDRFASRSDLLFNLEKIQAYGAKLQKEAASGQADLFGALAGGDSSGFQTPEVEIAPAPAQHLEKEQLLWERELMGIYVSAHPLDKYDKYFEEQTHPLSFVSPAQEDRLVTVGGIISDVRTIVTKTGGKMAFVKVEGRGSEIEAIVFPGIYESVGGKLVQDNVVKVTGRVNSKDRSGVMTSETKLLAEELVVISDEILENYQSTGESLPEPVAAPQRARGRRASAEFKGQRVSDSSASPGVSRSVATNAVAPANPAPVQVPPAVDNKKLYILIKNPDDVELLTEFKRRCGLHPGMTEIILVIGESDKKALRLSFRVDSSDEAVADLAALLGEDCVKLK